MKKIFYLIVALLLISGFIPWSTGYFFKQNYLRVIADFNQHNATQIRVVSYHAGWLQSQAIIQIIPSSSRIYKDDLTTITFDQHIAHGPIVYDSTQKRLRIALAAMQDTIHLADKIETFLFGKPKSQGIGTIHSIVHFNGWWSQHIQIPPMTIQVQNIISKIFWEGVNGDVDILVHANRVTQIKSNLLFGALSVKGNEKMPTTMQFVFLLQPITEKSNSLLHPIGLWSGNLQSTIPGISLQNASNLVFNAEALAFDGMSTITATNMLSFTNTMSIQKIEIPNYIIPTITALNLNFSLDNINAGELVHFINIAKNTEKNDPAKFDNLEKQYTELFPRLITATTHVGLHFSANTTLGAVLLTGEVNWPENKALPTTMDELRNNISAKSAIRIAIPLAQVMLNQFFTDVAKRGAEKMSASNTVNNTAVSSPQKDIFKNAVAKFMQEGKLPLSTAIQVMTLYDTNISSSEFATHLTQLGVPPATEAELMQLYAQKNSAATPAILPNTANNQAAAQQALADTMKNKFDALLQQGYIVKENDDYVVSITYIDGVMKVNGKELPQKTVVTPSVVPTAQPTTMQLTPAR